MRLKTIVTIFLAGTLFGVGVHSLGAAFKGSAVFRDVPASHYADEAIGEMYQLGIIKGLDSAHFGPDEPLTRGQAALLFKRLRDEIKGISSSLSSSSVSSSVSSSASSSVSSSSSSSVSSSYNPAGAVRFDSNGYNVDRNVALGEVSIAIVRTGGNQGSGTVQYVFSGGTAVPGKDYTPSSGTLTFVNKETSKKLKIPIFNNTATPGHKTVNLVLKNPTGFTLGTPNIVTLTIVDPTSTAPVSSSSSAGSTSAATTVSLGASGYGVEENKGTITISVVRTGVTTTAVGVNYQTNDSTAKSGTDYSATSGTLNFASGEETKSFQVSVTNNSAIEGSRAFTVMLTTPTGGTAIGQNGSTVTISDDETITFSGTGSLKFSAATYSVLESQGNAVITVNHVLGYGPVSVSFATSNGSAISGNDYTAVSGTLSFAQGEVSKTFLVPLFKDALVETEEAVNLTLSSPTANATLMDPSTATLKISD